MGLLLLRCRRLYFFVVGVIVTFLSVAAVIYIVGSVAFRSSVDMRENGRKWEEMGGGRRRVEEYTCILVLKMTNIQWLSWHRRIYYEMYDLPKVKNE